MHAYPVVITACLFLSAGTVSAPPTAAVWLDRYTQALDSLHSIVLYDRPLRPGEGRIMTFENVRFEQRDGAWIAVEADVHLQKNFGGANRVTTRYHYRATDVLLGPDHEALGSFDNPLERPGNDPELRNGTWVYQAGERDKYLWQDGKLVPDEKPHRRR
jgi:hypothetical protein